MNIGFCLPLNGAWAGPVDGLEKELGPSVRFIRGVEACLEAFPELDAVVANPVERGFYERAASLKALFVPFVGLNHLPADLLLARGVAVYNCHGNAESVAERALALALAGFGRVVEYHNDLREGRWHGFWVGKGRDDFWRSLYRKKVTILGVGAIGTELARLLGAFSCAVTGWRRRIDLPAPPGFARIEADLAAALAGADLVVAALPLTEDTRGLVDARAMEAMASAFLVNVGRGEVVDERALYEALRDGVLSGAGIDVWYRYPSDGSVTGAPSRYPIHLLPNVVLSPHVAGSTWEAVEANAAQTVENLALWLRTGDARNRVDLAAAY